MTDELNQKIYKEIRRDLLRTAIKQPLLTMIQDAKDKPEDVAKPIPVMVEANDDYYAGKEQAVKDMQELVKTIAGVELPSIGSAQNPYYKTSLTPQQILDIVDRDDADATEKVNAEKEHAEAATPGAATLPKQVGRYLAIRRIWYNHPITPLIDKSVSTVKADAAQRAFLAEGREIVWAVIDSGIDRKHEHFLTKGTLDVALPIQHCDFTPGGDQNSAQVDKFGHGSHVAGIIAGAYISSATTPKAKATRTKLGLGDQVETFDEELSQIAGMAPSCKLVSLKVLDDNGNGDVSNIIAAIDRIQTINDFGRNLKIHGVNLSVGYEFDPLWFACGQSPVCGEVDRLVRSGVVVVAAAGNTGYGTLSANQRATGAGFMLTINDPGNAELAITVGSTHRDSPHTYGVSYFSSKGPTGDGRMKPDLVAPGERILSCCSSMKSSANATNIYVEDSGTSMAAPHVCGVIAAFLSIRREYIGEPEKVKELFLSTATDLGRNAYFQGRGLVDLMRAIQSI
jgi:serine protease AprX